MTDVFNVTSERIDDVPLIIEICKQLKLDQLVDKHLGTHGLQQGLTNGNLTIGWLSYIISQSDHHMNIVRDWANKIPTVLSSLLGSQIRDVDFSDDQLGNLLDRFAKDNAWEALENELWKNIVLVFDVRSNTIRFDGTAACGYHDITENGLMQFGASKDHRPDLPQLKIMAASIDPGITDRGEWSLENNFRILKKSHLGISPLFVRKNERLKGLCRLFSLALRLIALIQYRIRESLDVSKDVIKGLENGRPNSTTHKPTTLSILNRFSREQMTVSIFTLGDKTQYHMTPLDDDLKNILRHLKIPTSVYEVKRYECSD